MARLITLGSLCIDHVYRVPGISGVGETVASLSHQVFPGGKGLNQSLAAARAGASVVHVGCVGDDGAMLQEVLSAAGVDTSGVRMLHGEVSGHAVIQVNEAGENAIVIAGGANRLLTTDDLGRAIDAAKPGDWILLQNEINDLPSALAAAKSAPAKVAFNVAPVDGREADYDLSGVDLLIVNEIEAAALAGLTPDQPREAVERLAAANSTMTVVATLGRDGLLYQEPGQTLRELDAFPVIAEDETAAGDAFIGYCLAGLLADHSLPAALEQGSAAGALAVTLPGAASSIPELADVQKFLKENPGR